VNYLQNSGFERGLEGWSAYGEAPGLSDQAYAGHGAARLVNAGSPKAMGIRQQTDLLIRPNETVTLSCYYRVMRPTTDLQWVIDTTAYPKFGAAVLLEDEERLPSGDWRRASISATNATGAPQRVTIVSVLSNTFTGEVLLDDVQLELSPRPSPYTEGAPARATRLAYRLPPPEAPPPASTAPHPHRRHVRSRPSSSLIAHPSSLPQDWTLSAWSAPEMPPTGDSYACLAATEISPSGTGRAPQTPALELRLRVDPQRSDPYGWVGALEVGRSRSAYLRLPMVLAPGQPLFWALSGGRGGVTLRAAPEGYRLTSVAALAAGPTVPLRALSLGSDTAGGHPLNGLTGGARLVPQALSLPAVERARAAAGG
jgi:hypothetical protein